jgi:hypothetical protein
LLARAMSSALTPAPARTLPVFRFYIYNEDLTGTLRENL